LSWSIPNNSCRKCMFNVPLARGIFFVTIRQS
jgi:hypothetical protein